MNQDPGDFMRDLIPIVGVAGGVLVAIVAIIVSGTRSAARSREREQTKREIAAYVAEGSISSEDAARLLEAGARGDKMSSSCCGGKRRGAAVGVEARGATA